MMIDPGENISMGQYCNVGTSVIHIIPTIRGYHEIIYYIFLANQNYPDTDDIEY